MAGFWKGRHVLQFAPEVYAVPGLVKAAGTLHNDSWDKKIAKI